MSPSENGEDLDLPRLPGNGLKTKVQQLQAIANRVDKGDPTGQLQVWRDYSKSIDEIGERVRSTAGVKLRRNFKTNVPHYPKRQYFILTVLSMLIVGAAGAALWPVCWHLYATDEKTNLNGGDITQYYLSMIGFGMFVTASGYAAWFFARVELRQYFTPRTVVLHMKPALHIDELRTINKYVDEMPGETNYRHSFRDALNKIQVDPVVPLPSITLKISRKWLSQQAIHDVMNIIDTKLPARHNYPD